MRIAIDARLYSSTAGGDSTYWTGLLRKLDGLEGDFVAFHQENTQLEARSWSRVRPLKIGAKSTRWWSLVRFPLAARKARCDLIHTQYTLSPLCGNRGITTVHDVSFLIEPGWFTPKDRLILGRSVPLSCARAQRVITVSESSKREIEFHIPSATNKLRVTYLAPHPDLRIMKREDAIKELGHRLPGGRFALTVSSIWKRKNTEMIVRLFEDHAHEWDCDLVLTGRNIERLASNHPRIHFLGFVSSDLVSALYSTANLYLCPSLHEGFGLPVLEAFQAGCPVIASSHGAIPEIAGKENAVFVDPTQPRAWKEAIANALDDELSLGPMIDSARKRASEFSWDRMAKETVDVYHEALVD